MRVAMIGTGYVGLVSGACFADFGHHVTCVDKDASKIETLKSGGIPIYEPGLDVLVEKNVREGRLDFATDLSDAVRASDAVFIGVGTPSRRGDGFADLSYVYAAAEEIANEMDGYTVVVTKSTVPVGTGDEVETRIRAARSDGEFAVVSNPEFLREGAAIEDFKRPDRIVVGTDDERARDVMRELYRPLYLNETPILFTNRRTSELIKYAANAFLAMKITYINEIADLCEKVDADVQAVARGIGLDNRIGGKFLHAGPGYGGSCFPKDTLALTRTAQEADAPLAIIETVVKVNDERKSAMARKVVKRVRRLGRRQDDRGPRPDVQTQHRRHARGPEPRHRSGAARGRREGPRLRPGRHGGSAKADAGRDLLRRPLSRRRRGRRRGHRHRVEPVPRA